MERETITEADCRACRVCCRSGTKLKLTDDEFVTLETAGTVMKKVGEPEERWDQRSTYLFVSDCGNLTESGCAIFGQKERPLICWGGFPTGGIGCREIRSRSQKSHV